MTTVHPVLKTATRQVRLFNPVIHEDAIAAAAEVMRSGWIGMGPQTAAFEKEFAVALKASHAGVATNTCTSALHLAFRLLHLPAGSEVVTTANTFVASNQVLLWENLTPVFADIDPVTGNIDPQELERKITSRTRAIMVVHFAGSPCDMDAIEAIAKKCDLPIVEDAAHACGASYKGRRIGTGENFVAFSFGATKNLTTGDGGMLMLPTIDLVEKARSLRYLGLSKDIYQRVAAGSKASHFWEYDVPATGLRYHMNDIAAAMGRVQLKYLFNENEQRAVIASEYRTLLAKIPGLTVPPTAPECESSNYLFHVLAENRDALADALMSRGIIVSVHYKPNSQLPIFNQTPLPRAEAFYARELSLPIRPDLSIEDVQYVADCIRKGW